MLSSAKGIVNAIAHCARLCQQFIGTVDTEKCIQRQQQHCRIIHGRRDLNRLMRIGNCRVLSGRQRESCAPSS